LQKQIFSVSELTRKIKFQLENGFASIMLEGEISNLTNARSGHWYFTLKDSFAQISCVMFKGQNRYLDKVPKDGAQVLMRGRINVYEPRGNYQFIADSMEDRGTGLLMQRYEKLKKKLADEGLFDEDHKKELPYLPERIALVTSPEGAAVKDMIRVISRRFKTVSMVVVPALVQGDRAPSEIVAAIKKAEKLSNVELLIVGRGGGSIEDLWAFNDEAVAKAIYNCKVPVISAVGHEVDFTIADFVADKRAATPSQAGELAVPVLEELEDELSALYNRLKRSITHVVTDAKLELEQKAAKLKSPRSRLQDMRLELDGLSHRLNLSLPQAVKKYERELALLEARLNRQSPVLKFERMSSHFKLLKMALQENIKLQMRGSKENLANQAIRLDTLSPLSVLSRGYSMLTDEEGKIVRNATDLKPDDNIVAYPEKGVIKAKVVEVESFKN